MKFLLLHFLLTLTLVANCQTAAIIPKPNKLVVGNGNFVITPNTKIIVLGSNFQNSAAFITQYIKDYYGFKLHISNNISANSNAIVLNYQKLQKPNKGAYNLTVNTKSIEINGDNEEGVFYGIQTLIQLLPIEKSNALKINAVSIDDEPRFEYRGLHLDVSRHFFKVDYIKKYIDFIALHKMNVFHWHLTDDQGWRIEIKKYPLLTSVGGCRNGTIIGRYPGTGFDSTQYCGYYTQKEVKEVVEYASKRYVDVIPEIEMPGHSMSVLSAYPMYSTTPNIQQAVSTTWGINNVFNNVLNPTEQTFSFLEDVLKEVMPLFKSKYVHIGGDECSKKWWEQSEFCQNLMKEKNLKNAHELQSYFIQRIEKFINKNGKEIIGWDEILEGGLAPNALVMSWQGEKGGILAAKQHHKVIMTPGTHCYFDHQQMKKEDSVTIGRYTSTEKVYSYNPIPKELSIDEGKYILGAQANVWTEYISNTKKLEYMLFPRLSALCEVLWSNTKDKNYIDFKERLQTQFKRYNLWNINYFKGNIDIEK